MANRSDTRPEDARVDYLVDEQGSPIALPHENEGVRGSRGSESTVGGTGPTNWWRLGLVVLGVLALLLLILQLMNGGVNTSVVPGTPTTPPAQLQPQGG